MLSKQLKILRAKNNLSQAKLAQKLGVTQQAVAKWETDKATPDYEILLSISKLFNISTDALLGNEPRQDNLPQLTPKDEREIARDLENMIESLKGSAAMGDVEDEEDKELLRASLETAMKLSKRIAKKKFTPKKYRKE